MTNTPHVDSYLDDEERELFEAIEADNYETGKSLLSPELMAQMQDAARNTLNETSEKISIQISQSDLARVKARAAHLTDLACRRGIGSTLIAHLDGRGDPLLNRADMAAVRWLLQDPDAGTLIPLPAAALETQTLTITAIEERTGRRAMWSDTRLKGSDPGMGWDLPLPHFSGPLRINLSLPTCHSPRDLGASADPRPLGLLLHSLRMESAPERLAAAE